MTEYTDPTKRNAPAGGRAVVPPRDRDLSDGDGITQANDGPPYDTRHTAADPGHVHREEDVDNDDKALPSNKVPALLLAALAVGLAILTVILDATEFDLAALVVGIIAVAVGAVATYMASNDARASPVVPALCLTAAAIALLITFTDLLTAETGAADLADPDGATIVAPTTIDDSDVPADPANIVEGTPEQRDIASDAVRQVE